MTRYFCDICNAEISASMNYAATPHNVAVIQEGKEFAVHVQIFGEVGAPAEPGHLCGRCYSEIMFKILPFKVDFATGKVVDEEGGKEG